LTPIGTFRQVRTRLLALTIAAAIVIVVAGLVIAKTGSIENAGWFAYAPRADEPSVPQIVTSRELFGWAVSVAGLVILGAAGGYLVGSRRR